MNDTLVTILGTLISASALVVVGLFTYRSTRKKDTVTAEVSKEANAITWSKDLLGRLEKLEGEVTSVRNDLNAITRTLRISTNYIERLWQWGTSGSRPPIPDIPETLYTHLDPTLIDEHHRRQREHNPKD
jgi:hypothetical protein